MSNTAILLAGGNSSRMQSYVDDKILMVIQGKPVFAYSIEAFIESEVVDSLVIAYKDIQQKALIEQWIYDNIDGANSLEIFWAQGGLRRQDSVFAGLKALTHKTEYVFIHDLARPLIQAESIRRIYQTLLVEDAAVLAHPVTDTIKQILPESLNMPKDLNRNSLWAMETPQAFKYSLAYKAYEEVDRRNLQITDDAAALSLIGHPIAIVKNDLPNPKITLQSDVDYLEFLLTKKHYAAI